MSPVARQGLYNSFYGLLVVALAAILINAFLFEFAVLMFACGALVSWLNLFALGSGWVLFFDKKRVALAFAIIISKYAFLMLIIYWILQSRLFANGDSGDAVSEFSALALGFVAYLLVFGLLMALKTEK